MKFKQLIPLCTAALFLLTGCSKSTSSQGLSYTDMLFDTVISVEIYDDADESILEECKELCTNYDNMFSNTNPDSEISKINQAGGEPVEVSDETITLIQTGIDYGELSGGAFDITISPVADLWDFKTDTPSLPDASALEEALTHVNYKNIQIDGNYVSLSDPEAAIDVGGIAKGYIADRLKEYLQSQGIEHAMINLGGNVLAMGAKLDGSDYNIGIQDPFDSEGNPITAVQIADQTVVTSGTYERFFKIDDTIYHHILNPSTGYPYENGLSSVTIITDSSLEADALSTTCFALGYEDGMNLINQLDGVDAIFITTDEEVHYSDDFTNHS